MFSNFSGSVRGEDYSLVDAAGKGCPVYVSKDADRELYGSANDLCKYLKLISGADFSINKIDLDVLPSGFGIVVGVADDRKAQESLAGDGFIMRTNGDKLHLYGKTSRGSSFAVYAFLEDVLGCRWWSCDEEDVPKAESLKISSLNIVRNPRFLQTELMNSEAKDRTSRFYLKSKSVNTESFTGSHTIQPMLKEYAESHPGIYPMVPEEKGSKTLVRKFNNLHYCYSAPDIADALSAALEKEVVNKKGNVRDWIYFAGMGDWYGGMCLCERCQGIYDDEAWTNPDGKKLPGYSATLIRMINEVARKLEKKYPGIRVGTFAYMSLENPPAKTKPDKNVVIQMPHLRHCIAHPVSECGKNRNYCQSLQRWCELSPGNVYIWDYAVNFGDNFMMPFPVIRSMGENIRFYSNLGCGGVLLQGNYVSTGSDLVVLKNYVWRRCIWEPETKVDDLISEFCDGYYGPAAAAMKKYVLLLEDAASENKEHFDEFAMPVELRKKILTDELIARMRICLGDALKSADGREPYQRRIKEAEASLEALELWCYNGKPRILEEDGGELCINGEYISTRIRSMLDYSRKSSAREFGTYKTYHELLLSASGGPLLKLSGGDLSVDVAPLQKGRIYQIRFKGRPVLQSQYLSTDKKLSKRPAVLRGSFESLQNDPEIYQVKERSDTRIVMQGECGIGCWKAVQSIATKTIEIKNGNTIMIGGESERTDSRIESKDNKEEVSTAITDYRISPGKAFALETSSDRKSWNKFDLDSALKAQEGKADFKTGKSASCDLPANACAFRIYFPDTGITVEDSYLAPGVEGSKIIWDSAEGVLTTEVKSKTVVNGWKSKGIYPEKWLEREIRFKE